MELSTHLVRDDEGRRERGHVTVHALADRRWAVLRPETLERVTGEAPTRELDYITLLAVHVMTGGARHL
jgi:hypothetical protein